MTEIGYSGRSVRNTDPIQSMIRNIIDGGDINQINSMSPGIKARIIRDLNDISQGVLPMWMPKKFKLPINKKKDLIKQLSKVDSR